jgi:hypothetical protein
MQYGALRALGCLAARKQKQGRGSLNLEGEEGGWRGAMSMDRLQQEQDKVAK